MPGCAVSTCSNKDSNTKGTGIIYHCFPHDTQLNAVWKHKCFRKDNFDVRNSRICSVHFDEDCYIRDLKSELLGEPVKKRLKKDAVPKKKLPFLNTTLSNSEINRKCRMEEESRKAICESILREFNANASENQTDAQNTSGTASTNNSEIQNVSCSDKRLKRLEESLAKKETVISRLKSQNCRLKKVNRQLKQQLSQSKRLKSQMLSQVRKKLNEILGSILTPGQIKRLASRKRSAWETVDIVRALSIRALSLRTYLHLKNVIGIPLPGITTLKRWTKEIKCSPGQQEDVLSLMKVHAANKKNMELACVIMFDEMSIDGRISYDAGNKRIIGPPQNLQLILARGLFSNWKQIIYYDFDQQMTPTILNETIMNLESCGYPVLGMVCDLDGTNSKLCNELSINTENTSFTNPHDESRKIFVFADTPHLVKLLRNHFLDSGIEIGNGVNINKKLIEDILVRDKSELKMTKLTLKHLDVTGNEHQSLYLAVQLFSHHTAMAIKYFFPDREIESNFFQLVNDYFDVMDSRTLENPKNQLASAFGKYPEKQLNVLYSMLETIQTVQANGKSSLLPFQKGIVISIKSLLGLYESDYIVLTLGVKYILTSALNQNSLENVICQIRGMGQFHSIPLPSDVKARIRLLFLGARGLETKTSCTDPEYDTSGSMLTANILESLNVSKRAPQKHGSGDFMNTSVSENGATTSYDYDKVNLMETDENTLTRMLV